VSKPSRCPACEHLERATIDRALAAGQASRSVVRRYAGLNRKALTRHRDESLQLETKGAAA
jgi:hypothetical protein